MAPPVFFARNEAGFRESPFGTIYRGAVRESDPFYLGLRTRGPCPAFPDFPEDLMPRMLLCLSALFSLMACASSYHPIERNGFDYASGVASPGVEFKYKLQALQGTGNPGYAARASNYGVDVTAVKIRNTGDRPIVVGEDVEYLEEGKPIKPVPAKRAAGTINQGVGGSALWLLLMPINGFTSSTSCDGYSGCETSTNIIPIGLIAGPVMALINLVRASTANTEMAKDLESGDLLGKTLQPGEEATGYLVFRRLEDRVLAARLKNAGGLIGGNFPDGHPSIDPAVDQAVDQAAESATDSATAPKK